MTDEELRQHILNGYRQHPKLKPERRVYYDKGEEGVILCCGMGAAIVDLGYEEELKQKKPSWISRAAGWLGRSEAWVCGFEEGWDGHDFVIMPPERQSDYEAGYYFGQQMYREVMEMRR